MGDSVDRSLVVQWSDVIDVCILKIIPESKEKSEKGYREQKEERFRKCQGKQLQNKETHPLQMSLV